MGTRDVIFFYVVLVLSFVFMAAILWWMGNVSGIPTYAKEATTTIAGGIFGGACYAFWENAFIKQRISKEPIIR